MVRKKSAARWLAAAAGAVASLLFILSGIFGESRAGQEDAARAEGKGSLGRLMRRELAETLKKGVYDLCAPCVSFAEEDESRGHWVLFGQIEGVFPLYGYIRQDIGEKQEGASSFREILLAEAEEGPPEGQEAQTEGEKPLADLFEAENESFRTSWPKTPFVPREKMQEVDLLALEDYTTLVEQFYTVDGNTMAGSDQLDVRRFLEKDMRVQKEGEGPQILIFHTHSQEGFADSLPGDAAASIVGVGERLTEILTKDYGYNVLHHTAEYDVQTRDDAYSRALPDLKEVLRENPSIQVVLDLHRDEMPESTRLVMDLDGRPTARFMFFNGLSRTKKTGNIAYLYNENQDWNLAFSFQMQWKALQYYPGLTRKIYLRGYRYNMHLMEKYLLVELGAQNNTLEEAMNACEPLAHLLDLVLSGDSH